MSGLACEPAMRAVEEYDPDTSFVLVAAVHIQSFVYACRIIGERLPYLVA
jgi:hypothetical protein